MIVWISGAYGVGKSALAEAMAAQMENALIFDAEEVGNAVRGNYPNHPYGFVFEDYPMWAECCCLLLKDIHNLFHKDILVPMTLMRRESYRIIQRLKDDSIETQLVILDADHQTIHDRILKRGEKEGCWCMEHIDLSREGAAALPGLHIAAAGVSAEALADRVLHALGIKAMPPEG